MLLGSHVSMKGKEMLLGSAQQAAEFGANTFMIYTGAPQNTRRKPIEELNIQAAQELIAAKNLGPIVVHAPYIVNLGNTVKPENFKFAIEFLQQEVIRAEALGASQIVLHPGAHVGAGADAGIQQIIKGLNEVLRPDQTAQIAQMIDGVTLNDKLSVTFDTCHTSDAGYNIREDFDGVLNEFDHIIGLDRLKVVHLNDSKNPQGAHKDRHANIGFGEIGFDALHGVVTHPQLVDVPKIMETPYVGEDKKHNFAPYAYEIAMLKKGEFDPELLTKIEQNEGRL